MSQEVRDLAADTLETIWRMGPGAGCLEVGPGMCQLLQEPREDAGNTGVFQEVWERGALSWLHRGGGI